jgi:hypothetical protein
MEGELVLAERQKVDVDELLVDPDFEQNPSTASRDAELKEIAQRSSEFGDLFDGVPNPVHDSEAEPAEQKKRDAMKVVQKKHDSEAEHARKVDIPLRSSRRCELFLRACFLLDIWQWKGGPLRFKDVIRDGLKFASSPPDEGDPQQISTDTAAQPKGASQQEGRNPAIMDLFGFVTTLVIYIYLVLSPIVLTFDAWRRGEQDALTFTFSLGPAFVPLVFHGFFAAVYIKWAERLDQATKRELIVDRAEIVRARRKGSDISCATTENEKDHLSKIFRERVRKKTVETQRSNKCYVWVFGFFVFCIFSIGINVIFFGLLRPQLPYRPQFLGGENLLVECPFLYSLTASLLSRRLFC